MSEQTVQEPQKLSFQTEAKQLLNLVIHSLYSHKEIFLRELISNASDALDRLRFEAVSRPDIISTGTEFSIHITIDKNGRTITVSDNGIGMTKDELVENIGTIARSGSREFLEKLTGDQKADSNLIGQFGVGFYSVFMVASSVKLVTKRAGSDEPAVQWESDGVSDYTISEADKKDHGTSITLYLKDEEKTYTEPWQLRGIIKKYSDYIAFPIYLPNDKGNEEIVNETKPLWLKSPSEITDEHYKEFYKHGLGGFEDPLFYLHSRAEGVTEYSSLAYVPSKAPFDLFQMERKHGIRLYVKRVFIMDDCKELLPEYLRFVKGIVDSEDLPLNVSREMLQHNPVIGRIRKTLVGKILGKLKELSRDEADRFLTFWKQFGAVVKEGLHSDHENRDTLLEIVRFQSSMGQTEDDLVTLKQYVERMRENQKHIYYISGENRAIVEKSPHLEVFREKSIEVLYLVDPIDEFVVPGLYNFEGKEFRSITKGELDLGELSKDEPAKTKKDSPKLKKLTERMKNILSDSVKDVRSTTRLKDSPACLVADEHDMGAHMEKIMKAMGQTVEPSKHILEINPAHPVIENMNKIYETNPKDMTLEEWVRLLFDQAVIAEGRMVSDPLAYTRRVNNLLVEAGKHYSVTSE